MKKNWILPASAAVLLALAGLAGWYWWQQRAATAAPQLEVAEQTVAPPAPPAAASQPAIRHPIETTEPTLAATQTIEAALPALFGREKVLTMFQTDDFVRRVVVTVDNIGRVHAPSKLWPMNPAPGRFTVDTAGGNVVVSAGNSQRYNAHVLLLEAADMKQVYALYRQFYPQFQQAYEELGYPKRYFNDRLVEVLDQLLATPDSQGPPSVHLPVTEGIAPPQRPWVLYDFDDPALQRLSAGQKLLLRLGPTHARRVKARLEEFRQLVATGTPMR